MKKISIFILSFLMCLFMFVPNASAITLDGSEYPDLPTPYENNYYFITKANSNGNIVIYIFDSPIDSIIFNDDTHIVITLTQDVYNVDRYNFTNGATDWKNLSDSNPYNSYYSITIASGGVKTVYSSVDVYDRYGELVFQVPQDRQTMAELMLGIVTLEIPSLETKMAGTVRVLLLCGVGCLALLVVLKVFGKVFARFLP